MALLQDSSKTNWFLKGNLPNARSWIIPITKFPFQIGRNLDCDLSLNSRNVSRNQAVISLKNNTLIIQDLKSTNGTFVTYKKIKKDTPIEHGDMLQFGDFEFQVIYQIPEDGNFFTKTNLLDESLNDNEFVSYFRLTKKEKEILFYLLEGKSTSFIAKTLSISAGTAKNHILNIYKKTKVHSKFELLTLFNKFHKKKK